MRRALRWAALVAILVAGAAGAQESARAAEAAEPPAEAEHGSLEWWKWANFALLAGVLGWAVGKNAGPWFAARSRAIRKQMVDAEELQGEARRKTKAIEDRLANLEAEIAGMRREALAEEEAEAQRLRRQTAAEMAKIQEHARQEIEAAGNQARVELKRYSAALAVRLAEQRIRARMTSSTQDALVRSFVETLGRPASRAHTP